MKKICLLGASGSIGISTLDIIKTFPNEFNLISVSINHNISVLKKIIKNFPSIKFVCVAGEDTSQLKKEFPHITFLEKEISLIELIKLSRPNMVINALVGFVGLIPTVYSIENDIDVALANKETLVAGGELINSLLKKHPHSHLYPIDSEHVALAKCLKNKDIKDVKRLIITASGGAFRDLKTDQLHNVKVEDALKHPSWNMGAKITIDSATLVNKAFEIIEAYHLFHFPSEKIDVLLHDESIIHSMIEMNDHSLVADIGPADMRIPISFALFQQEYKENDNLPSIDLARLGAVHFRILDLNRYPALNLARKVIKQGGTLGCCFNAANEACNKAFRENKLPFDQIVPLIEKIMNEHCNISNPTLKDLIMVNEITYKKSEEYIKEIAK